MKLTIELNAKMEYSRKQLETIWFYANEEISNFIAKAPASGMNTFDKFGGVPCKLSIEIDETKQD